MAEARIEEDDGELREQRESSIRRSQRHSSPSADHLERHKPDHCQPSQGPLSSIRAVISRTSASVRGRPRERRRPEITILSAEPIAANSWFLGASGGFPPSSPALQPVWGGSIPVVGQPPPSYDQVIKEKKQEGVNPPSATVRRATSTTATQTDLQLVAVASGQEVNVMSVSPSGDVEKKRSNLRRPPPRPLFPGHIKPASRDTTGVPEISQKDAPLSKCSDTSIHRTQNESSVLDLNCKFVSDASTAVSGQSDAGTELVCLISLDTSENNEPRVSSSAPLVDCDLREDTRRPLPVPRPRLKQTGTNEVKVQTLVRLKDDGGTAQLSPTKGEVIPGKYLQELLDIFSSEDQCLPSSLPEETALGEPADQEEDMSALRAKIKAFEKQSSASIEAAEDEKPEPRPRVQQPKPPEVAPKPSLAPKPSNKNFWQDGLPPGSTVQMEKSKDASPYCAPRSHVPAASAEEPVNETPPDRRPSRPPVAPRVRSFISLNKIALPESHTPAGQGAPSVDLVDIDSHSTDIQPSQTNAGSKDANVCNVAAKRNSSPPVVPRKPAMIKLPSKSGKLTEGESVEPPPPLPVEKPVSGPSPAVPQKPSLAPKPVAEPRSPESSDSQSAAGFLSENSAPLCSTEKKIPPPRPPPFKGTSGRPPPRRPGPCPPRPDVRPKPVLNQVQPKKGSAPPPRPIPAPALQCRQAKDELLIDLDQDRSTLESQLVNTKTEELQPPTAPIALSSSLDLQVLQPVQVQKDCPLQAELLQGFTPGSPHELSINVGDPAPMVVKMESDRGLPGPVNHVKAVGDTNPANEKKESPSPGIVSGPRCVARFDFRGKQSDELSLTEGDVIRLREYVDQEWARGDLNGRVGIFPLNFVEIVEELPASVAQQADTSSCLKKTQENITCSEAGTEWALALYSFTAQTEEDLSFKQGEKILIVRHVNSEWCCGRLRGKEGLFPKAFVQIHTGEKCGV